ncbi:MAG: hypothetical protein EAZ18_07490 [Oscillatoriales cyanobacterium]|nr:MAG: hypothetical protein EAZ18_07490 [Oscillatoriales cyanobacterium]
MSSSVLFKRTFAIREGIDSRLDWWGMQGLADSQLKLTRFGHCHFLSFGNINIVLIQNPKPVLSEALH